jgi:hypothetical protein
MEEYFHFRSEPSSGKTSILEIVLPVARQQNAQTATLGREMGGIIIWTMAAFIYLKVATALLFSHGLNLVGSFIGGGYVAIVAYGMAAVMAGSYKRSGLASQVGRAEPAETQMITELAIVGIISSAAAGFGIWLLSIGFDDKFADRLGFDFSWNSTRGENTLWFLVIAGAPIAVDAVVSIWAVVSTDRMRRMAMASVDDPDLVARQRGEDS